MSERELKIALEEARAKITELDETLKSLAEEPMMMGTICQVDREQKRIVVSGGKGLINMALPPKEKVKPGLGCLIFRNGAVFKTYEQPDACGRVVTVGKVIDDKAIEVQLGGEPAVVWSNGKAEKGDRVVLDPTGVIVIRNLGQVPQPAPTEAAIGWEDIGGLDDAKAALIEAIEMPHKYPEVYKRYRKGQTKGVLLYGPPGCGKTMLGKASMTSIAKSHGKPVGSGFIYVKGPEVLNMYVGNSEATVRRLFDDARKHKREHGYPAIIFIDEAEAILGKRGTDHTSSISRTLVPAFLADMDGIEDSSAIVMLATNRQDILDPAVVREGRVDRKVRVSRPTATLAEDIFKLHLKGRPTKGDKLAEHATAELFLDTRIMSRVRLSGGGVREFRLRNIVSGALIAGVVEQASLLAMYREISTGKKDGITEADMTQALDRVQVSNAEVDHSDEMMLFAESAGQQIVGVERVAA